MAKRFYGHAWKMFNPDIVPRSYKSAVRELCRALDAEVRLHILKHKRRTPWATEALTEFLIANWSLNRRDTVLVRHFRREYKLRHRKQIAELIIEGAWRRVRGEEFKPSRYAKKLRGV